MESVEFHQKLRSAWSFLSGDINLARSVSSLRSLPVSDAFNSVALDPGSTYEAIYRAALSLSYYNIILNDYSVFQFSWTTRNEWRLAYLPNPWIAGVNSAESLVREWEALEAGGEISSIDFEQLIAELPYFGSIPQVRFDYSVSQYKEMSHPAAHLHIGRHTENRWPLARVLNPLTFSMSIAKTYYSEAWRRLSSFGDGDGENCVDKRFIDELGQASMVYFFSEAECRSLHLSNVRSINAD